MFAYIHFNEKEALALIRIKNPLVAALAVGGAAHRIDHDEINNASNDLARLRVHFACADAFSRALVRNVTLHEFLSRDAQEQMISLTQLPPKSRRVKSLQ
jgi:hypothetical protein